MKKLLGKSVIYVSKQLTEVDTTQQKFFPFLGNTMVASTAQQHITVKGLHAMCNWSNIKLWVPHGKDFQEFVFFGRSNVGKSTLINKLVRREMVEASKKPGKTK
jgi:ribosome biogenesis GTPase A